MTKEQIRERALIDAIIRSANSHFWYHISRLLGVSLPVKYEEKFKLFRKIKGHFE